MNDKELIAELKTLQGIKPEPAWKQETREVLLAQISNSVGAEVKVNGFEIMVYEFKNFFSFLPAAAWAMICLAIILTGGTMGALAAKNSKPGDTLYIAKVWKEKIQLMLTFNQEDKAKLDMKLASIHAQEITEVLSSPNFNAAGNEKKAEELAQNFQQEINTVKERLSEINRMRDNGSPSSKVANNASGNSALENDNVKVGIGGIQKASDSKVYSVESGKENTGMQFYNPSGGLKDINGAAASSSSRPTSSTLPAASSSAAAVNAASSTPNASAKINSSLDQAAQSFATKDFTEAKNILDQVGKIIANIDSGSVKGATEAGTSTGGGTESAGGAGSSSGQTTGNK
ncbi:MAG TPA: DUF5667 domain-containing protein [Candidatus Nanoarchaeia archaeon]|nr:DUF5667 domain-containing protein [Candidatus Nanoarchaeia archaeon]